MSLISPAAVQIYGCLSPRSARIARRTRALLASCFAVLLGVRQLTAAPPPRALSDDYFIRVWDTSRGLLDPTVRSLAQTADGMIWAGTFGGIGSIDGARTRWDYAPASELPTDNWFVSLHVDRHDLLWAGTKEAILRHDTNGWRAFGPKDGFPGGLVLSIAETANGDVFFAYTNEVSRWNGSRFETMPRPPRDPGNGPPLRLAVDTDDRLWAISNMQMSRWDGRQWIFEEHAETGDNYLGLGASRSGGVWVAGKRTVRRRRPGAWGATHDLPAGFQGDIAAFAEDRDGNLYCGLFEQGLVVFRADGGLLTATEADGLSHTHIPVLLADRDGSVWLGSGGGGAMQLVPRRFAVLHGGNSRSTENHITALWEEKDGQILFASNLGHFYESDGGRERTNPETASAELLRPRAILRDRAGVLWCATPNRGIVFLKEGQWRDFPLGDARPAHCLHEGPDGDLWIGFAWGYAVLGGEGFNRRVSYMTNLPGPVWQIAGAPDGALWMATGAGAYRAPPGLSEAIFQPGVAGTNAVSEIAVESTGEVWAIVEPRLVRSLGGRRFEYGEANGIKLGRASSLLRDDDGNWWIGDFSGIQRLDRRSLDNAASGAEPSVQHALYNRAAGLSADIAWVLSYNCGLRARDGRMWIASRRGLVAFDPRRFPLLPSRPRVAINAVITETSTNSLSPGQSYVRLPAGTKSFSVDFSAIEPTYGERLSYEFQAGSTNSPWISLSAGNQAHFPSAGAGRYPVRVRAFNIDGRASEVPVTIEVETPPVFWERGDIRAGAVAALAVIGGGVGWVVRRRRVARDAEHARFSTVLQSTADLVLFADANHKVTYINDAGRRMLDFFAAASVQGRAIASLFSPRSREVWNGAVCDALKADKLWRGVIEFENDVGMPIPAAVGVAAHRRSDGQIDFYSIVGHDIREVMGAESAKREMQEMLELVVDSVPIRLGFVGPDERYRWVSREVERARRIPAAQLVGKTMREVWGDEVYTVVRQPMHKALSGEPQRFEATFPIGGAVRHHEISLLPHANLSGEIRGVLVVVVDVTTLKENAEKRRELEDRLQAQRKLEALGTLAGGVAHDFNNLLAVMVGNLDLARLGGPLTREADMALEEIRGATDRARDLVRQILLFSRRDSQRRQSIDIAPTVRDAIRLLRSAVPSSCRIEVNIGQCPPVLADPGQIHQIAQNLINNAVQALRGLPGTVEIRMSPIEVSETLALGIPGLRPGLYVILSVRDTGVGMDDATLRRIFEPFFTTKPVGQGTGLGLAVVHGIVVAHGGAIHVETKPDQGSAFSVYLPAAASAAAPDAETAAPGKPAAVLPGRGRRFLVVDDEPAVLALGRSMLEKLGYKVESFSDPAAALVRFKAAPDIWDAALTDFTMPGINGLQLAQWISEVRPGLPVILSSGMAAALDETTLRASGVGFLLNKPYSMGELTGILAQLWAESGAP